MYDHKIDITSGIDSNIWRAIDKSIENNNKELFRELSRFIKNVLGLSIKHKSLKYFQSYIFFPTFYYSSANEKLKYNSSLFRLAKICVETAAIDLKSIILYDIGIQERKTTELENQKILNNFYYYAFCGFSKLLHFILMNHDINTFRMALDEYDQLNNMMYSRNYELKYNINALKRKNENGINNDKINSLNEQYQIEEQFYTYKRHVLIGLKYWIYYLYHLDKLNYETAVGFLERIKVPYAEPEDLLRDILYFRNRGLNSYMGWNEWDFMKRVSGKSYSPPDPHYWMTLGFIADLIKGNGFSINIHDLDSNEISNSSYLYDDLKNYSEIFNKDFLKWENILNIKTPAEVSDKIRPILDRFALIKRTNISIKEKSIANAPLIQKKIENFKNSIGEAWKTQALIHQIFKKVGNIELVTDENIELRIVGDRIFYEKAKFMFIDGKYSDIIYGIESTGGEIGRAEDDEFFNTVMKHEHTTIYEKSAEEVISKSIEELKRKNIEPNIILLSNDYMFKDDMLLGNKRFKYKSNILEKSVENTLPYFLFGEFDNIPVYTSHSFFLNNRILVCNFNTAFKMRYRKNSTWFEEELKVDVKEVDNEEAKRRLQENPDKWKKADDGFILGENDAITLIKTSVIMEIWVTVDFQVLDPKSYIFGIVKSEKEVK